MKLIVFWSMLAAASMSLAAAQTPAKTIWDGVYTADQATRGETLYSQTCVKCHGPELAGIDKAPALVGKDFNVDWNGLSVNDLFERIRISMPDDNKGTLTRQQVADLVAFLLSKGGFPAGSAELPTDAETLQTIGYVTEKP